MKSDLRLFALDLADFLLLGNQQSGSDAATDAFYLLSQLEEQQRKRVKEHKRHIRKQEKEVREGKRKEVDSPPRRMFLDRYQLLQVAVYRSVQVHRDPLRRDLALEYLEFLSCFSLTGTSFDSSIAVNLFIYDLRVKDSLRFYGFLANDERSESYASTKKNQLFEKLKTHFGYLILEDSPGDKGVRRFINEEMVDATRIETYLLQLAPWKASCDVPSGYKTTQRLNDLHPPEGSPNLRSGRENQRFEVNRVYALFHPAIYRHLGALLGFNPKLRIPKLHNSRPSPPCGSAP